MKEIGTEKVGIATITVGERLRAVDDGHVQQLVESIRQAGLQVPIIVRPVKGDEFGSYALVSGAHRLAAATLLGWKEIKATVIEADDNEALLAEIDENLVRHELNPLDRAVFMGEREAVYRKMHPETAQGGDRKSADFEAKNQNDIVSLRSFAEDTAEKCGWTARTVQRALEIHKKLKPDVRARIAGTVLAKKQSELLALAKQPRSIQHEVLDLLLAVPEPAARTVADALDVINEVEKTVLPPSEIKFRKLLDAWDRADTKARRRFLEMIEADGQIAAVLGKGAGDVCFLHGGTKDADTTDVKGEAA